MPAVKYVVDVAEGVLLAQDRDHSVLKSSPISLALAIPPAPARSCCSGPSPRRRGRRRGGSPRASSPCSVTGESASLGPRLLLRLRGAESPAPLPLPFRLPPLDGRGPGSDDDRGRAWPRARKASRTSSPSSDGVRSRCMLLLRLDGWLASLSDAIVARVGGREDAVEDVATDAEPMPVPPAPLTSVAERRLASSREPTDSIVGMRLMTPPSTAMGSSDGTSRPNSSIDMYGVCVSRT